MSDIKAVITPRITMSVDGNLFYPWKQGVFCIQANRLDIIEICIFTTTNFDHNLISWTCKYLSEGSTTNSLETFFLEVFNKVVSIHLGFDLFDSHRSGTPVGLLSKFGEKIHCSCQQVNVVSHLLTKYDK